MDCGTNKAKLQQHHQPQSQQQQQHQHQQQQQPSNNSKTTPNQLVEALPPRYQPPPQPGILKTVSLATGNNGNGNNHLLHHQQQHLYHQQQAARLASQVKEAVQSKFAQKVELPPHATDKLQQPGGKATSFLSPAAAAGIPASSVPAAGPPGVITTANGVAVPPSGGVRQRLTDEDLLRLGPVEMLKFVRKTESDMARLAAEQHRQIQSLVNELRALKEANQRLSDDNQELRDLCCFLDDDRQKGRKLAREWQRFGRYTASVMRQEVSAYQNKLRQLDNKQQELIKDNLELKELCLYLDEERTGHNNNNNNNGNNGNPNAGSNQRDDGDGSSSSTNADESAPALPPQHHHHHHSHHHQLPPRHHHHGNNNNPNNNNNNNNNNLHSQPNVHPHQQQTQQQQHHAHGQPNAFNDQAMQYVRSLEQRVKQLEEDKSVLQARAQQQQQQQAWDNPRSPVAAAGAVNNDDDEDFHLGSRPEAVVRALQVLEVREQLEREAGHDGEKALVREMCNVVWRKLEEGPALNRH